MPGCADQAVHADCPHLFDHVDLPPHYVNCFTPGFDLGYAAGQTAVVAGSHALENCRNMQDDRGLLEASIVRPHLKPGDALMFDCRALHFGTANGLEKGEEGWRPVVYVNYWREFYADGKNWDDRESLNLT